MKGGWQRKTKLVCNPTALMEEGAKAECGVNATFIIPSMCKSARGGGGGGGEAGKFIQS